MEVKEPRVISVISSTSSPRYFSNLSALYKTLDRKEVGLSVHTLRKYLRDRKEGVLTPTGLTIHRGPLEKDPKG